jgi:hypothetical protein
LIAGNAVLAGKVHAGEVRGDDLVPHRLRQVVDLAVARGVEDAGVGHEDIEPAEALDHRPEGGGDIVLAADIGGDGHGRAARRADLRAGRLGGIPLPVDDGDLAAFGSEPLGGCLADARPGTGDRGHLALQPTHRLLPKVARADGIVSKDRVKAR